MTKIKVLPEAVARQIAAGEVVERPASVVKELIENALDAGADAITINTAGAGGSLIEVRDNGVGMSAEDVVLAPKSFSTSKISGPDDLFRIETYGFRGEALASISAVSRFEIVSSDQSAGEGWKLSVEGKTILENAPAPHERGTSVRVRDLFFNTPARKKFLKSELTERRRILETILSSALISPGLEIHYADDGKPVLDLVPNSSWRERIASILGASSMKHMVEIESQPGPLRLTGFASLPTHTRGNRNHQFLYVNRRQVKERTVVQAVHEAYRGVVPYKRFPVIVLSLVVPFDDVDVNVHPSKLEVRLNHPRQVFETVRGAIKRALSSRSESSLQVAYTPGASSNVSGEVAVGRSGVSTPPGVQPLWEGNLRVREDSVDDYRTRVKSAYSSYMSGESPLHDLNPQLSLQTEGKKDDAAAESVAALKERVQSDDTLFWQFNHTYIFIQVRGGIVIIDQHAAHERVIFDTSKKRLENEVPVSQQILFPIHLELSLSELDVFKTSQDIFGELGFHLEAFGGKSILVRGYPQGVRNWNEGRLLLQIFDDIAQDRVPGNSHTDRIIASFACRSAVKAGQKLCVEEMKMLADQLFAVPNPYSCPHGRPTIQRISLEDVESWFLRR